MARGKRIKRVLVKLMLAGEKPVTREFRTPAGKVFTQDGIDGIIRQVVEEAEEKGLGNVLRVVRIGHAEFNLVPCAREAI